MHLRSGYYGVDRGRRQTSRCDPKGQAIRYGGYSDESRSRRRVRTAQSSRSENVRKRLLRFRRRFGLGLLGFRRILFGLILFGLIWLGRVRENEGGFTRAVQLQFLANLQLLRRWTLRQLLDAVAPIFVFALKIGVVFFQLAN